MIQSAINRPGRRGAAVLALAATAILAGASPRLRGLLANTALLAGGTLAIALPVGALLGVVIAKIDVPGRRLLAALLTGLLFVPLYVQAAAWGAVLGTGGWVAQTVDSAGYAQPWLTGWRGAIWIHAMAAIPWAALLTAAGLMAVERRLEEESLLDASPARVLWRVSLRRGAGGVLAAAAWIAVVCATEITVTDLFQIRTFAEEVYTEATLGQLLGSTAQFLASDLALGVAALVLLAGATLWLVAPWLSAAASVAADAAWTWRPARGRWAIGGAAWALTAIVLLIPLAGIAWKAGIEVRQIDGGYLRTWSPAKATAMVAASPWEHRREWGWSLAIGAMAAVAATTAGLALAWTARIHALAAPIVGGAIALGLAIPAPLLGVWVIGLLNHPLDSPLAPLTTLYDRTLLAPVLVQTARALPLAALWLWTQLVTAPDDLLDASRSEGAGRLTQLFRIVVPLRRWGVAGAAAAALIVAVGELSATLLVVPPGVTTVSVRIFQLLHNGVDDRVAALSLAIFGATVLGVAAVIAGNSIRRGRHVPGRPLS